MLELSPHTIASTIAVRIDLPRRTATAAPFVIAARSASSDQAPTPLATSDEILEPLTE